MTKNNNVLNVFFIVLVLSSAILVCLPTIGYSEVIVELLISFRIHVCVFLVFILLLLIFKRSYFLAGIQLLFIIYNIYPVVSSYSFSDYNYACNKGLGQDHIRVMSFNVYYKNSEYSSVYQNIRSANADIVLLQEAQPGFTDYGHSLLVADYPFYYPNFEQGKHDRWTLYSRYPVVMSNRKKTKGLALHSKIDVNGTIVEVVTLHAKSPKTRERIAVRNRRINELSIVVKDIVDNNRHVIVAGDFNNVPWHPSMKGFKNITKLKSNDVMSGYFGTWPAWLPSFVSVPIDHIFFSEGFHHVSYNRGSSSGSDHYPVISDLYFCE